MTNAPATLLASVTPLPGGDLVRFAPALLLADEPTGNLKSSNEELTPLRRLNVEHHTMVLFMTHNNALAADSIRTIREADGVVTG